MAIKKIKTTSRFLTNTFWIALVIGLILIILSMLDNTFSTEIRDLLEKLGLSIFTSGVFAVILKSFQFTGIFKKEIEDIILHSDFIDKRNDLVDLWKKISIGVYNKKFPEISDNLHTLILDSYFPINKIHYYYDFRCTFNIEKFDGTCVHFTQSYSYRVKFAEGVEETISTYSNIVDKVNTDPKNVSEKEYLKIDGDDILPSLGVPEEIDQGYSIKYRYKYTIKKGSEKKDPLIESKDRKVMNIHKDNIKIFRVNTITKEMDVSIKYPKNLMVNFFNIGLVQNFEHKHVEHENMISRVHKSSLILPFQGFGMAFASNGVKTIEQDATVSLDKEAVVSADKKLMNKN